MATARAVDRRRLRHARRKTRRSPSRSMPRRDACRESLNLRAPRGLATGRRSRVGVRAILARDLLFTAHQPVRLQQAGVRGSPARGRIRATSKERRTKGRKTNVPRSPKRRAFATCWLCLAVACCLASCSPQGGYPDVKATTPVGSAGVCHHCGRTLERVEAAQVVDLGSAWYVACSPSCATELTTWHRQQAGKQSP